MLHYEEESFSFKTDRYKIYSFRVWTHGLENNSFIQLSCIAIATRGGIFKEILYKNNI